MAIVRNFYDFKMPGGCRMWLTGYRLWCSDCIAEQMEGRVGPVSCVVDFDPGILM